MIAKVRKGASFGGCVRYVMNASAEVLAAEGVVADDAATIIRDFAIQRSGRPEIKQPVGHIAVSFSPEDSPRMTGDFMLTLAHEYMQEMGIGNTQYIVVRHHNTDHEHFHIVYNRIDNDLKLISVNNDYHRNVAACKKLKDRHGLTYGVGKEKVNRAKLTGADRVKYQIHDEIAACLPHCATYADLEKRLLQAGITMQYKYRRGAPESPENVQGVSFAKGDYSFKGSQVDRAFSHAGLSKAFDANLDAAVKEFLSGDEPTKQTALSITPSPKPQQLPAPEKLRESELPVPPQQADPESVKHEIHAAITSNLRNCVLLFNLGERLQSAGITMHLKYRSGALHSPDNVQGVSFEKYGLTFKGSEIDRNFSHANLTKTLDLNFEKWFNANVKPDEPTVKEKETPTPPSVNPSSESSKPQASERQAQPSPDQPKPSTPEAPKQQGPPKSPTPPRRMCYGAEISEKQWDTLQSGGHIYVENMTHSRDGTVFSSYVFLDDEKKQVFFSYDDPDKFVKYGKYEMRLRDKMQLERGYVVKSTVKWWGGGFARPYLWKDRPDDPEYKESFYDPRLPEEVREKHRQELENRTQRTIPTPTNGPKFRR